MANSITILPIANLGNINEGSDLISMIADALLSNEVQDGDIVVIAHKIISKAEGRVVHMDSAVPSERALELAAITKKDPRQIQVILDESREVLYAQEGVLVCLDKRGLACANAGVDASNAEPRQLVLLPEDPDGSAKQLHDALTKKLNKKFGIIICDTHGRPFRNGAAGICIGACGIVTQKSYIGQKDLYGYVMKSSIEAVSDELAAAATLVMGQGSEGIPVAIIRGYDGLGSGTAKENIRSKESDIAMQLMSNNMNAKA